MQQAIIHHYRRCRQHQAENNGGGAAEGFHASCALSSAKSHIHFMKNLKSKISKHKKASRAARRGWKTRRANEG
ncbi:MAG: hypothetical protein COA78_06795 [Blastopirellula sp.]|nr:MAG: hypothetical protein COA78_06795 [Blastopirellula sp.]